MVYKCKLLFVNQEIDFLIYKRGNCFPLDFSENKRSQNGTVLPQVNPELKDRFEEKGMKFVGQDVEGERMEVVELEGEHLLPGEGEE